MDDSNDWNQALLLKIARLTADKDNTALNLIPQLKLTDNKKVYHLAETLRGLERYEEALVKYHEYQLEPSKHRMKTYPMELGYLHKPTGIFLCLVELGRYEEALQPLNQIKSRASNPDAVYETIYKQVLHSTKLALDNEAHQKAGTHLDALQRYQDVLFGFLPTQPTLKLWYELLLRLDRNNEANTIMEHIST